MQPILIGLPGAGKSTVSRVFAQRHNLKVVSTDPLFRVYRAIPADSSVKGAEIMQRFLARAADEFPDKVEGLRAAARPADGEGDSKCSLHDSKLFRSFGEKVFRTFEIEMLRWLFEQGMFADSIPDLSASAPLFPENQTLFSRANGFLPIFIDAPESLLLDRLERDYKEHRQRSAEQGRTVRIRGGYELVVEKSLAEKNPASGAEWRRVVREALAIQSAKDRIAREATYRSFCVETIPVSEELTPTQIADLVQEIVT